jgi:hypothetical protein
MLRILKKIVGFKQNMLTNTKVDVVACMASGVNSMLNE